MARPSLCVTTLMLLPCLLACVVDACSSKSKGGANSQTTVDPHYEDGTVSIRKTSQSVRFRRSFSQTVDDLATMEPGMTEAMNAEVFGQLDMDADGFLTVIEWSIEGGSVKDFWALLTNYDEDGDENISYSEFSTLKVKTR